MYKYFSVHTIPENVWLGVTVENQKVKDRIDNPINIRKEFIDNIKRLRHHASLALWCGNNEMEMFVKQGTWVTKPTEMRDHLLLFQAFLQTGMTENQTQMHI